MYICFDISIIYQLHLKIVHLAHGNLTAPLAASKALSSCDATQLCLLSVMHASITTLSQKAERLFESSLIEAKLGPPHIIQHFRPPVRHAGEVIVIAVLLHTLPSQTRVTNLRYTLTSFGREIGPYTLHYRQSRQERAGEIGFDSMDAHMCVYISVLD
jgi:hypothetical protein